jgi:hypothetical protein
LARVLIEGLSPLRGAKASTNISGARLRELLRLALPVE